MKLRKLRKRAQEAIKYNRAWDWSFERLIRGVCAAYQRFDKHIQASMGDTSAFKVERYRP